MILGGTGSVGGGSGWYLVVLGQYKAEPVDHTDPELQAIVQGLEVNSP